MNITDFCAEIKNYFDVKRSFGNYIIKDGKIIIPDMLEGQYFRICGSVFNDGVYQYPADGLIDEAFDGAVWYMAVPPEVLSMVAEMDEWETKNADVINSPYTSESFGGYSYTKSSGNTSAGGDGAIDAFTHFSNKLKRWRKVRNV